MRVRCGGYRFGRKMGYLIKAGSASSSSSAPIIVFNVKLIELMEIGTCASGNTPLRDRPGRAPRARDEHVARHRLAVPAGLIGAGLFAFRGDPPWGRRKRSLGLFGLGSLAWGFFFAQPGGHALHGLHERHVGPTVSWRARSSTSSSSSWGSRRSCRPCGTWRGRRGRPGTRPRARARLEGALGGGSGMLGKLSRHRAGTAGRKGDKQMKWGSAGKAAAGGGDAIGRIERLQKCASRARSPTPSFRRKRRRSSPDSGGNRAARPVIGELGAGRLASHQ